MIRWHQNSIYRFDRYIHSHVPHFDYVCDNGINRDRMWSINTKEAVSFWNYLTEYSSVNKFSRDRKEEEKRMSMKKSFLSDSLHDSVLNSKKRSVQMSYNNGLWLYNYHRWMDLVSTRNLVDNIHLFFPNVVVHRDNLRTGRERKRRRKKKVIRWKRIFLII